MATFREELCLAHGHLGHVTTSDSSSKGTTIIFIWKSKHMLGGDFSALLCGATDTGRNWEELGGRRASPLPALFAMQRPRLWPGVRDSAGDDGQKLPFGNSTTERRRLSHGYCGETPSTEAGGRALWSRTIVTRAQSSA